MDTPSLHQSQSQRLHSLDVLCGFDMIWIMGLGYIIEDYSATRQGAFWSVIHTQFKQGMAWVCILGFNFSAFYVPGRCIYSLFYWQSA